MGTTYFHPITLKIGKTKAQTLHLPSKSAHGQGGWCMGVLNGWGCVGGDCYSQWQVN